ncbi:MAG: DUF4350 domain-containing protein [Armatimonadia bacterium]
MKPRTLPIVIVVCLVVFSVVYSLLTAHQATFDPYCDHSSLRTNQWGTKALRELLQSTGLRVQTLGEPWTSLGPEVRLLWVLDPQLVATEGEVLALLQWVRQGGTLIVAPDARPANRGMNPGSAEADLRLLAALGYLAVDTGPRDKPVEVGRGKDPLLREVRRLEVQGWRLRANPEATEVQSALNAVRFQKDRRSTLPRRLLTARSEVLVADDRGVLMARLRHGRGQVLLLSDADLVANRDLPRADNVVLAANLSFAAPDATVWFDEYHHRRRADSTPLSGLDTSAPRRAILAALFALGLYLLGRTVRFGTAIPVTQPSGRSAVEYVQAFAALYRRAGHRTAAAEMIASHFRSRLARAGGARPDDRPERLAEAVAARNPNLDPGEVLALLHELADTSRLDDNRFLSLTRHVAHLEQELTTRDL